jgi:hypothetical protein
MSFIVSLYDIMRTPISCSLIVLVDLFQKNSGRKGPHADIGSLKGSELTDIYLAKKFCSLMGLSGLG